MSSPMHHKSMGKPHAWMECITLQEATSKPTNTRASDRADSSTRQKNFVSDAAARESFIKGLHSKAYAARYTASVSPWRYYTQDVGHPKAVSKAAVISRALGAQSEETVRISSARAAMQSEAEGHVKGKCMLSPFLNAPQDCLADASSPELLTTSIRDARHQVAADERALGARESQTGLNADVGQMGGKSLKCLTWHASTKQGGLPGDGHMIDQVWKPPASTATFQNSSPVAGPPGAQPQAGDSDLLKLARDSQGDDAYCDASTPYQSLHDPGERASTELAFFHQYERQCELAKQSGGTGKDGGEEQQRQASERDKQHRARHPPAPASVFFY